MAEWWQYFTQDFQYVLASAVLIGGWIAGYLIGHINRRILQSAGIPKTVEGSSLERTARKFGTDTVSLVARGTSWLFYIISVLYALAVARIVETRVILSRAAELLPLYLLAILIVMVGFLAGDKAELLVSEYLRGVKLPEVNIIGPIVRYTVVFIALLLALAQIGVAIGVLLIFLGGYLFAVVVFTAAATYQLLASGAAGLYLLLNQPFGIGDRVEIDDREGVVQEVDLFVTRIEENGREYIIPNHLVFRNGAVLIRD